MKISSDARRASFLLAVTASTSGLLGCSGGTGAAAPYGEDSSRNTGVGSSKATLAARAFALQTAPAAVMTSSVTFLSTAEVASLRSGDVIAAATATIATSTPYLRQIVSVATDSPAVGQTTFETTVASLDDLFADADLAQTVTVTSGDINAAADLGKTSGPHLLDFDALPSGGKQWNLGDEGSKGIVGLGGNAKVDFSESFFRVSGGLDFAYQKISTFDLLPHHLRMVLTGGITTRIGAALSADVGVHYVAPEIEYGEHVPLGTVIVTAGPVPIPIVLSLGFTGSAQVGLDTGAKLHEAVTGAFQLQSGFDYTDSGGTTAVASHKELISHDRFAVDGEVSGSFRLYPLSAKLEFAIFDVAGPFLELDPYLGLEVDKAESGATVKGLYGMEGHLGGDMTIFHKKLTGLDLTLFDASGTFGACKTTALVCSAGPLVEE